MTHFVLFILYIPTICAGTLLMSPVGDFAEIMYSIGANIANKHFVQNFDTVLYSQDTFSLDLLNIFLQKYEGGIITNYFDHTSVSKLNLFQRCGQYHVTQYVIMVEHYKALIHILSIIQRDPFFDHNSQFIIICDHDNSKHGCNAKLTFDVSWKNRITNVVLLDYDENKQIFVMTYFPQSSGQCQNTEPVILDTISTVEEYTGQVNLFPDKFYNFNQCPLIVSTVHYPPTVIIQSDTQTGVKLGGSLGPLIHKLAQALNATLQVIVPRDEQIFGAFDGTTWTGCLGDIFTERANMSICSIFTTIEQMSVFRTSYPRKLDTFVWVSPPNKLRPAWEKLINPFDSLLRLYLSLFLLLIYIAMVIISKTKLRRVWNSHFIQNPMRDGTYLQACAIFLGQVSSFRPKKMVLSFLLALWVWFSFFMRSSYQGALVGALKHDAYEPRYKTLREYVRAGYEFGGSKNLIGSLADEPDLHTLYKIVKRKEKEYYFSNMANGSLHFLIMESLEQVSQFNLMIKKSNQLNVLPQLAMFFPYSDQFPRNSPFVETVNTVYGRFTASGIKGKSLAANNVIKHFYDLKEECLRETEDNLTMHNMKACFAVLILGCILSAVVFSIELLYAKYISSGISIHKCFKLSYS